jgi:hypothetical protein
MVDFSLPDSFYSSPAMGAVSQVSFYCLALGGCRPAGDVVDGVDMLVPIIIHGTHWPASSCESSTA